MITQYHRPQTLDEALKLLSRPNTFPLGGGTLLSHRQSDSVEVVDLQALGLNSIKKSGNNLEIGATATLQQLFEDPNCPTGLKPGLKLEAPLNLRNAATVAGAIVACDGRSTFVTALLALDAKLTIIKSKLETVNLGDFIPLRPRGLITTISIPLQAKIASDYVSRTPADKPIVCVALAQWPSGRTRLAVGGYGKAPMLAMDGTEAEAASTIEAAARNAFHEAKDEWASAEYRQDVAATLAKRCREHGMKPA
ncbi:MAG: FAD binding domain-containing protein [Anaerolineales bacterium]